MSTKEEEEGDEGWLVKSREEEKERKSVTGEEEEGK